MCFAKGNPRPWSSMTPLADNSDDDAEAEVEEEVIGDDAEPEVEEEVIGDDAEAESEEVPVYSSYSSTSTSVEDFDVELTPPPYSIKDLNRKSYEFELERVKFWEKGESVPFSFIDECLTLRESSESSTTTIEFLSHFFMSIWENSPFQDLLFIWELLSTGFHEMGMDLQVETVLKSLVDISTGLSYDVFSQEFLSDADDDFTGTVQRLLQLQPALPQQGPLTISRVYEACTTIGKDSGGVEIIQSILAAANDVEIGYLLNVLIQRIPRSRLFNRGTLITALAHSAVLLENTGASNPHLEEAANILKQVLRVNVDLQEMKILGTLETERIWDLPNFYLAFGKPVGVMLAKQVFDFTEVLHRTMSCEFLMVGKRAQIHYECIDDFEKVEIFKDDLKSFEFPDLLHLIKRVKTDHVNSFIIDVLLCVFERKTEICVLDILYHNGQKLLKDELKDRREILVNSFSQEPGCFQIVTSVVSRFDDDTLRSFCNEAMHSERCEGLIFKFEAAPYESSRRSGNWLKIRKEHFNSRW